MTRKEKTEKLNLIITKFLETKCDNIFILNKFSLFSHILGVLIELEEKEITKEQVFKALKNRKLITYKSSIDSYEFNQDKIKEFLEKYSKNKKDEQEFFMDEKIQKIIKSEIENYVLPAIADVIRDYVKKVIEENLIISISLKNKKEEQ